MFPNAVMMKPETWNEILRAMIAVRDAHGWREEAEETAAVESTLVIQTNGSTTTAKHVVRKVAAKRITVKGKPKTKAPARKAKAAKKPKKSGKPLKKGKMKKGRSKSAKSKPRKSAAKSKKAARKPAKKKR